MPLKFLLFCWLWAGPALAQAVRPTPPVHRIPDAALRRVLARQGFITNGALNSKAYHWDQLHISGKDIKNLEGIQYMANVMWLTINETNLTRLDHLPPYLQYFDCSNNLLITLPLLPPPLTALDCHNNRLTQLPSLPSTLTSLVCSNNRLPRLPPMPPNLTFLNYAHNPIPDSTLPAAYQPLPCRTTGQNCQPNTLINWHILKGNIPDTTFEITGFQVVISSDANMTGTTSKETVQFQPWGDYLVAGSQLVEQHDYARNTAKGWYLRDTTFFQSINRVVTRRAIKKMLNDIHANALSFQLVVGDSLHNVDLRYKNLALGNIGSCSDCGNQEIAYTIHTNKAPIRLHYTFEFMGFEPISKPPSPQPQIQLLDWLYMYKLTQATIPNNALVKHYFRGQSLSEILHWAR